MKEIKIYVSYLRWSGRVKTYGNYFFLDGSRPSKLSLLKTLKKLVIWVISSCYPAWERSFRVFEAEAFAIDVNSKSTESLEFISKRRFASSGHLEDITALPGEFFS